MGKSKSRQAMELMAEAMSELGDGLLNEGKVRELCEKYVSEIVPIRHEFKINEQDWAAVDSPHGQMIEVMELIEQGHRNILLVGPSGTGKTTLARDIAKALNRDFHFLSLSAGVTESHLFGRILPKADGSWGHQSTPFIETYENGGVFLLDEVDAADPNLMVSVNAALANGHLCNVVTSENHVRHKDSVIIAAANTYGLGADAMYVGRNPLDASTLDRFVLTTVYLDYDKELEVRLAAGLDDDISKRLVTWVWHVRDKITQYRLRRVASTRLVVNARMAIKSGKDLEHVKKMFFQSWTDDEQGKVA